MNKDKEPLLSARDFFRKTLHKLGFTYVEPTKLTNSEFWLITTTAMEDYLKAYSKYHLNNVKEVICDNAKIDTDCMTYTVVDKQSITNAVDKYINENLKF